MTWVVVSTYAGYAATALTAASAVASADAGRRASNQNADASERGQRMSVQQAGAREDAQRRRARYALGSQAAAIAESGVDPNSGSASRSVAESATNAELDALNIRYEGLSQAQGYANEAANERQRARIATSSGYYGVASALVGGAGRKFSLRPTTVPNYGAIDASRAGDGLWGGAGAW